MVVKTITITEKAYMALKRLKGNDSFSDTILKISADRGNIGKFFGILPVEDAEEDRKRFREIRRKMGEDVEKRVHS
ncbi:MAG: antitoxin VapB family protein [Candidatus Aenigmarchaeota archaeon]|nr:antitoxin VapB family protein [Candidatus Aenigmarchaeota archaeon]